MAHACRNASWIAVGLIAWLELGCGGEGSKVVSGTGGTTGSGGQSTRDGGAGGSTTCSGAAALEAASPECNTVTNSAAAIPYTEGTGTAPVAAGGTIVDGLYEATKTEAWGSATPSGRKITFVVTGGTKFLWVGETRDATGGTVTGSFRGNTTASISGNEITFTSSCQTVPLPTTPMGYTATANELKLIYENTTAGYTALTTYTRRGCP